MAIPLAISRAARRIISEEQAQIRRNTDPRVVGSMKVLFQAHNVGNELIHRSLQVLQRIQISGMVVGDNFVLVCVGGVTNGGKTSLTTELKLRFPHMRYIKQDDFFLAPDDPRHVWVGNSMFRCQNWEIPESLDFVGLKEKVIFEEKLPDMA